MIMMREQDSLNFINEFHVATSGQIYGLFYSNSYRYCMKRLNDLVEQGYLKRTISTINNCHAYYIDKKPIQIHHDLIRAELYARLKKLYTVKEWVNEKTIDHTRPDALAYIEDHGIVFPVFIEIHLSNKFDFDKYKKLFRDPINMQAIFGIMPRVLICTDRQIKIPEHTGIKIKIVDLSMSGLDTLFK